MSVSLHHNQTHNLLLNIFEVNRSQIKCNQLHLKIFMEISEILASDVLIALPLRPKHPVANCGTLIVKNLKIF
jgi:hypothetical protein